MFKMYQKVPKGAKTSKDRKPKKKIKIKKMGNLVKER